ncbi:MAG: hypothetical protein AB9869_17935 [Verrucomicrobiia bacterium]
MSTEGMQTIIERGAVKAVDPKQGVFTEEGLIEIADAMILGGVTGGGMGVVGAVGEHRNARREDTISQLKGRSWESEPGRWASIQNADEQGVDILNSDGQAVRLAYRDMRTTPQDLLNRLNALPPTQRGQPGLPPVIPPPAPAAPTAPPPVAPAPTPTTPPTPNVTVGEAVTWNRRTGDALPVTVKALFFDKSLKEWFATIAAEDGTTYQTAVSALGKKTAPAPPANTEPRNIDGDEIGNAADG